MKCHWIYSCGRADDSLRVGFAPRYASRFRFDDCAASRRDIGAWLRGVGFLPRRAGFEPSLRTTLHFVMVSVNFLPFILVAFIFPAKMKGNDYWKKWALFSVVMGVLAVASFFIPKTVPLGLSQRIGMGANFLWLFITSQALFRKPSERL